MSGWWDRKLGTPQNRPSTENSSNPHLERYDREVNGVRDLATGRAFQNLDEALKAGYAGTGGEAARKEKNRCPNCGSGNVFTRTNTPFGGGVGGSGGTVMNENGQSAVVAARCFECNWNSAGYDLSAW